MKTKKGTYILLVVVCAIWIGIAVEIVGAFSGEEAVVSGVKKTFNSEQIKKLDKEVFTINNVKRDPFLGVSNANKLPKKRKQKVQEKTKVSWPQIRYSGHVKDKKGNTVYLLDINNEIAFMKQGGSQLGIKLLKGNKSTVWLKYKNELKEFNVISY